MPLFQNSVLKKHLAAQDISQINAAYQLFQTYFGNPAIRENIRNSKEEQFQEGFLRELFVNILGYTINPHPDFNLTTELKNIKDAKKTDGAILKDGKALAVIELKGTDTKDLEKIRDQAFNYKNNQHDCLYVVTSNFEKLRFYIHNAVDHHEFHLFNLSRTDFGLLWLFLQKDNLLSGIPAKIKEESLFVEERVTKQLYTDYSAFKQQLWQDMVAKNRGIDQLLLYKKSQKLLDRFLFIFFAEDKGLLPPNSISKIAIDWDMLHSLDAYVPLYDRFKLYFGFMNTGRNLPGRAEIHAYNGGLFAPDALLDSLIIDDQLLKKHTLKLSEYDFDTEVDTNILGHIFEHSLNDIENVRASIEGTEVDRTKTKRKKDGVFYTPKYITKYIVDHTVGKLCAEKKAEIQLVDEEFGEGKKNKKKKAELKVKLDSYRSWLLEITICDPACGSGAFLNQALEFLMGEHRYIDELESLLFDTPMVLPNVENHILERNIFGVDINEESVEIARLSLWLRTAKKGRKLSSLSSNIKVGNSLIDDPAVAGDLAFSWEKEFPQVFGSSLRDTKQSGFDVVIGNPPYVTRGLPDELKKAISNSYFTAQYQVDLYVTFMEKGIQSINSKGKIGFIVPNSWLKNMMMSNCRRFVLENLKLELIFPNLSNVFEEATVDTMIFIGAKSNYAGNVLISEFIDQSPTVKHELNQNRFLTNDSYIFDVEVNDNILPIFEKVSKDSKSVGAILDVIRGINPNDKYTGQDADIIKNRAYHESFQKDETFVPELKGQHIGRYFYNWDNKHFISYGEWLAAPRPIKYFEGPRIVFREILGKTLVSTYIEEDFKIDRSLYIARIDDSIDEKYDLKFLLGILNSKLLAFYFRYKNNEFDDLFPKIRVGEFKELPIKITSFEEQGRLSSIVSMMLDRLKLFSGHSNSFLNYLQSKFSIEKPSTKLQNWPSLDFKGFLGELSKAKVKLSLSEEAEWMTYFNEQKQKAQALKSDIDRIDREIDALVYELYGLTEEEIRIVEGA
jgi:type I restriction-modification system DNA methylase subunit